MTLFRMCMMAVLGLCGCSMGALGSEAMNSTSTFKSGVHLNLRCRNDEPFRELADQIPGMKPSLSA